MSEIDIAFTIYIVIILIGFLISYKYGSYLIRKTGQFFPPAFIAGTMIIAIDNNSNKKGLGEYIWKTFIGNFTVTMNMVFYKQWMVQNSQMKLWNIIL